MKKIIVIIGITTFLVGIAVQLSPTSFANMVGATQQVTLLNLFEKKYQWGDGKTAPTIGDLRRKTISEYFESCCKEEGAAMDLLQKNNFHIVSVIEDQKEVAHKSAEWNLNGKEYDKFIYAKRGPSIRRFWHINATYELVLFVKANRIEYVWANIDRAMP